MHACFESDTASASCTPALHRLLLRVPMRVHVRGARARARANADAHGPAPSAASPPPPRWDQSRKEASRRPSPARMRVRACV